MGKKGNSTLVKEVSRDNAPLIAGACKPAGDIIQVRLTEGETKHLTLIAGGYTIKEIAKKLSLARKTVETYRQRLKEKLNLENMAQLHKYAYDYAARKK